MRGQPLADLLELPLEARQRVLAKFRPSVPGRKGPSPLSPHRLVTSALITTLEREANLSLSLQKSKRFSLCVNKEATKHHLSRRTRERDGEPFP